MAKLETLIATLDTVYWEFSESFKDMPDEDLWKRPHPRLLSVGELAAHIAYGDDMGVTGGASESPLLKLPVDYYTKTLDAPTSPDMTAQALFDEVMRVHEFVKAALITADYEPEDKNPHRNGWTWLYTLQYMVFHVSYHTGQIYSVRHLLGHETVDN